MFLTFQSFKLIIILLFFILLNQQHSLKDSKSVNNKVLDDNIKYYEYFWVFSYK